MRGMMAWPSGTAKAPPGMKSFWTSMTRRASVGWTEITMDLRRRWTTVFANISRGQSERRQLSNQLHEPK